MGTLMIKESPRLKDIKTNRITKVESAIRIGDTIVLKLGDNTYSVCQHKKVEGWAFPLHFNFHWQREFIQALKKLGVLPSARANELIKAGEEKRQKEERESDLAYANKYAVKHGYKLVKESKDESA